MSLSAMDPVPLVSIVMPCWNAAPWLEQAIRSIQAQTCKEWELLLFDDGSEDGSLKIATALAAHDRRIHLMPSHHVGVVEALARGCAQARAPLLARMDADDIAAPHRLARQLDLMRASPDVALCGTQVAMIGARVGLGRRRYEAWQNALVAHEEIVREIFIECPLAHPTFLIRREAYEAVGGYEDRGWAEDYDLCMRLFVRGHRFAKVPEKLLDWREQPRRLSMTDPRYSPERFRALKRCYLRQTFLNGRGRFHQWGAGEVGKPWLREWAQAPESAGVTLDAVVDIHPRKIGRAIHDVRVIAPEELPRPGETFIVVAVGAPGARAEIRAWMGQHGFCELRDYVFVA